MNLTSLEVATQYLSLLRLMSRCGKGVFQHARFIYFLYSGHFDNVLHFSMVYFSMLSHLEPNCGMGVWWGNNVLLGVGLGWEPCVEGTRNQGARRKTLEENSKPKTTSFELNEFQLQYCLRVKVLV